CREISFLAGKIREGFEESGTSTGPGSWVGSKCDGNGQCMFSMEKERKLRWEEEVCTEGF
ncbi:hypothetical protein, partial [Klebsiella pneumoniae]|uniref:hypothetical protein n=1 Tax=Klebsiella pneumoniae TaxID=573 RepID=UPI0039C3AB5C